MHVSTSVMNKVRTNKNGTAQGVQNVTKRRVVRNSEPAFRNIKHAWK